MEFKCKICRLSKKNGQLLVYTDDLIRQGNSLRKISELVYLKFKVYVSKSSIQIHKGHYASGQLKEEQSHDFYSKSAKAITHY